MIKSGIADIMNSGGRWGGAVTAAKFLQEFVEDMPWIHLDIAGVAWMEEKKPYIAKGPSGIAVRSLVEFVRGFEAKRLEARRKAREQAEEGCEGQRQRRNTDATEKGKKRASLRCSALTTAFLFRR